jgi:hypothetical protein
VPAPARPAPPPDRRHKRFAPRLPSAEVASGSTQGWAVSLMPAKRVKELSNGRAVFRRVVVMDCVS